MTSTRKPLILTNFGYQRKNWIYPLEAIKEEFEVIYIHYNNKKDETNCFTNSTILYYTDFKNAQDLIEKTNPAVFLTMGLTSNLMFAIKHVCNKKGIPVVYMDHGLYGLEKDYKEFKNSVKKNSIKTVLVNEDEIRSRNIAFSLKTFTSSFAIFKLTALLTKILIEKIFKKICFQKYLANPDAFLTYSPLNNTLNNSIFKPKKKDIYYIGNFEYDKFKNDPEPSTETYLLMIDSPLSDNPQKQILFSIEDHVKLYNKINELAKNKNLKLKIKLHPFNYNSEWIPEINNVEFIKVCDINSLIKNASYCIGFYSTLLIPALYLIPTSVLTTYKNSFIDFLKSNELCFLYDMYNIDDIQIEFKPVLADKCTPFLENYINLSEISSIERIKLALKSIIDCKNRNY